MRDLFAEQLLSDLRIEYTFEPEFPISKDLFEVKGRSQSRLGAMLDRVWVERYKVAMEMGADFPGIIVEQMPTRNILREGHHRLESALEARKKTHPAYLVKIDDPIVRREFQNALNTRNGKPVSLTEQLEQAVAWCEETGRPATEIARRMYLKADAVQSRLREKKTRYSLAKAGVQVQNFTADQILRFSAIENTNVRIRLAKGLENHQMKLKSEKISDIVTRVRKGETEQEQLSIVDDILANDSEIKDAMRRMTTSNKIYAKRDRLFRLMHALNAEVDHQSVTALQLTAKGDLDNFEQLFFQFSENAERILMEGRMKLEEVRETASV